MIDGEASECIRKALASLADLKRELIAECKSDVGRASVAKCIREAAECVRSAQLASSR